MIVYPYQAPAEGEYFAKGDEDAMVNLAQRWAAEARKQQHASKYAQTYC